MTLNYQKEGINMTETEKLLNEERQAAERIKAMEAVRLEQERESAIAVAKSNMDYANARLSELTDTLSRDLMRVGKPRKILKERFKKAKTDFARFGEKLTLNDRRIIRMEVKRGEYHLKADIGWKLDAIKEARKNQCEKRSIHDKLAYGSSSCTTPCGTTSY